MQTNLHWQKAVSHSLWTGREMAGEDGEIIKGHEKTLDMIVVFNYFDCGDDFTGIYI